MTDCTRTPAGRRELWLRRLPCTRSRRAGRRGREPRPIAGRLLLRVRVFHRAERAAAAQRREVLARSRVALGAHRRAGKLTLWGDLERTYAG